MKRMWGAVAAIVAAGLMLGGCASNQPLELTNPSDAKNGFAADHFLPDVNTVDSGKLTLSGFGVYDGGGNPLVFTEPFSTSQLQIADQTTFNTGEQIYDLDGNGHPDYMILTLRALSAVAARSVDAIGPGATVVPGPTFYKIGGIAVLPVDATVDKPAQLTLPVSPKVSPTAGTTYQLYKWKSNYTGPAGPSATTPGVWQYVQDVTVDSTGSTVTFPISTFGEYAIVTASVPATAT